MLPVPDHITTTLQKLLGKSAAPWEATVYRYAASEYSRDKDFASGDGAYRAGGRWNPPCAFHAVYCSSAEELAHREYFASCRIAGIDEHNRMPIYGTVIRVKARHVIDFCDPELLKALGTTRAKVSENNWRSETDRGKVSYTQTLGLAAWQIGFQVMLVPSILAPTEADHNVVLIRENWRDIEKAWRIKK